jgi:hypothetical protein
LQCEVSDEKPRGAWSYEQDGKESEGKESVVDENKNGTHKSTDSIMLQEYEIKMASSGKRIVERFVPDGQHGQRKSWFLCVGV